MKEYIERAVAIERARNELDLINKSHWSADEIVDFLKRLPAADVVEYEEVENLLRWAVLHDWTWEEAQEHLQRLRAKMDGGADDAAD